ncbi:acyl-CoA reductase [Spongiimicrobium salis]|uniref:acyl-CoA reductase n=1 Tax=Spongiimicrobium salis TaxID=1667022 RepID=UPI00374D7602
MTDHQERIQAFVKLGEFFQGFCEYHNNPQGSDKNSDFWHQEFDEKIRQAKHQNGWFTTAQVVFSIQEWANVLKAEKLNAWLNAYSLVEKPPKTVALIMAGNIPLVGFHDFLCVLLSGNHVLVKLSSNDTLLIPFISHYLCHIMPSLKDSILFSEGQLENFDAVIATGSNNTSRYFEHYFGKKPHIIRKNRNSVAVLQGTETKEQLEALSKDIFCYYGLGCRSVSKLFVPKEYDFDAFFQAMYPHHPIINQIKYANNYDYNKAVYLMSEFDILDNGFLMIKEDKSYASPIATVFYETYDSLEALQLRLKNDKDQLQCIVSHGFTDKEVDFGQTQHPKLNDYADEVDTMEFLLKTRG